MFDRWNVPRVLRDRLLSRDGTIRIGYLTSMDARLHALLPPAQADSWMMTPNPYELFEGRTPIAYMADEGTPGFDHISELLDEPL